MSNATAKPAPQPTAWSQPYWDAAAEGRLLIQRCGSCEAVNMYPKRACPSCLSEDLGWTEASGRGTVYTFTVQERGAPSGFADAVPYVLAVVRLEEGVQLMTNIVGPGATEIRCDDPVQVEFPPPGPDGVVLPVFRPVAGEDR